MAHSTANSHAFTRQRLSIDFIALQQACPKGIYVAPVSEDSLLWSGVIFVRKGPYAHAVLRFHIAFPDGYPARPPVVTFTTDVFHPLVAPLTTYTYTTRDRGVDNISAADEEKLPAGGLTLRHGFPEWYSSESALPKEADQGNLTIEVLQYIRIILDTEVVIDSVPLEVAANPGAWHAWRSSRARLLNATQLPASGLTGSGISQERSMSPSKQQPGGARRPGEWNWRGVWEDRVKKAVAASISDATLFARDGMGHQIEFAKIDDEALEKLVTA